MPDRLKAVVVEGKIVSGDIDAPALPWWSFTKTVQGAAVLALASDGRLDLDAPMAGRDISLAEVLQHRAGLPDYGMMRTYHDAIARGDAPWSGDEFLERTAKLVAPPRGTFHYSNIGYLLISRTIEMVAGKDLGAALDDLVLRPLGVSGVRLARVKGDVLDPASGLQTDYDPGWVAHGLLIGPPAAAALLLDRLMTGDFLPAALMARMRDGMAVGGPWPDRPWRRAAYGLGLMMDRDGPAGRQFGHTGQSPDSLAAVYHFADLAQPRTVAVFSSGKDQGVIERDAIDLAQGH